MERDFLGLNTVSEEPLPVVKEELSTDGCKEIGFTKGSGMQWPFSNKVSAFRHLMSLKVAQEDKTKKIGSEVSCGFMSISSADACDPFQKRSTAEIQKLSNQNRQGGSHFSLTAYPAQHDVHPVHRPHDVKMFPAPNHPISVSMGTPFFSNHYSTTVQNPTGTAMKPQFLGEIPVPTTHSILPTVGSVAGMVDSSVKAPGSPAQLTIFYAGSVNVFNDITPEKAQAIMLLAGNGSCISSNSAQPKIQVQAPSSKPAEADFSPVNQPIASTPPSSRLSSPLSVSSHTGAQSGSGSTSTDEIMTTKRTGAAAPVTKPEPPKSANVTGSAATTTMIPSVPQARKASLARFLEKRKERVMNAAPYNLGK